VLYAEVEAELQRGGRATQPLFEGLLDPGEAPVVHAGEADHMRGQRAVRIDPVRLVLEVEPGDAETIDLVLLARCQLALEPDEGPVGRELGGELGPRDLRQGRGKPSGDRHGI
jgi:hypothetical protein